MASPYELNPYSFFGVGVAENMDDTQTLMNGFMRMAVDNAVLSGNLLIEVDETNFSSGARLISISGQRYLEDKVVLRVKLYLALSFQMYQEKIYSYLIRLDKLAMKAQAYLHSHMDKQVLQV